MNGFSDDRHSDLLRKYGPDIQPDWGANMLELFARHAFLFERLEYRPNFAFAADHPDIPGIRLNSPAQHVFVFLMTARHDNDVGVLVRSKRLERFLKTFGVDRFGFRKPLCVRISGAIVDDRGLETCNRGNF